MMKTWTSEHVFNHPWEKVTQAVWRKYPNPMNPAVICTDVIDRKVVDGSLITHRLVTSEWGLPSWARSILGPSGTCYASELSEANSQHKKMCLQTKNLSFRGVVSVDEKLTYEPHPQDISKTLVKQRAVVTVHGLPWSSHLENYLTNKISHNASKGREAMEWVISQIKSETENTKNSAVKIRDKMTTQTRRSIDEFRSSASRMTIDDIFLI